MHSARRFLLALLVILLPPIAKAAQDDKPMIVVAGRIQAEPRGGLFDSVFSETRQQTNNSFKAAEAAASAVRTDAEERLSLALEELQRDNPAFFDKVMKSYGLQLMPRGRQADQEQRPGKRSP